MTVLGIVLLVLAGILLFLLEFLVVPGVTIAGIGGLLFFAGAVYLAFENLGNTAGIIVLAVVVVTIIIALIYGLRAKTWSRISLSTQVKSRVNNVDSLSVEPGDKGLTITRLGPIGKVRIGDVNCEGQSIGPYIDENTEIEVVQVMTNHVIVKPIDNK
jgi:membrane-bound ClpP family serine protease